MNEIKDNVYELNRVIRQVKLENDNVFSTRLFKLDYNPIYAGEPKELKEFTETKLDKFMIGYTAAHRIIQQRKPIHIYSILIDALQKKVNSLLEEYHAVDVASLHFELKYVDEAANSAAYEVSYEIVKRND